LFEFAGLFEQMLAHKKVFYGQFKASFCFTGP